MTTQDGDEKNMHLKPRPIFVLGSHRSGTTLLGAYLTSSPEVCDMGEYIGYFLAHQIAKDAAKSIITYPHVERYISELKIYAYGGAWPYS